MLWILSWAQNYAQTAFTIEFSLNTENVHMNTLILYFEFEKVLIK